MDTPKADPTIYPNLRGHALEIRLAGLAEGAVHPTWRGEWPSGMLSTWCCSPRQA
jgi:hypothetical protein